ncbi:AAA family ATPase [Pseudomonas sp. JZ134]|uniref:AAA family ATPase n=1 Tax=Pseudomonas sp. JZ134 TaxID=2806615 RepID=UPI003DA10738
MKVIVLTGPESTGKSWLAQTLKDKLDGVLVGEYVREYFASLGRDTTYEDITPIARRQLEHEDAARQQRPALLILDTHLLSNILWSRFLFDDCPDWLEAALLARHYDLHLLLDPREVPWSNDGQRCQPDMRDRLAFYEACKTWLDNHKQTYRCIGGNWANRQRLALQYVTELLEG